MVGLVAQPGGRQDEALVGPAGLLDEFGWDVDGFAQLRSNDGAAGCY